MVGIVIAFLSLYFIFITDGIPVKPNSNGKLVEGDMIFPPGFNPKSSTRGVGFFGDRKWPNGIVPYDISAITGEYSINEYLIIFCFLLLCEQIVENDNRLLML